MKSMTRVIRLFASAATAACAPATAVTSSPAPATESRVFDASGARHIAFSQLADAAATADIVFFGEQHDDPATHRAELALLAAVGARRPNVVLSLEMFERDVQPVLDSYLAGQIPESTFLAQARPWPRYGTDYRAMVELARAHGWPVIASNVPRRIASAIGRGGLAVLDTIAMDAGAMARDLSCPHDSYYEKFAESMKGHSAGSGPPTAGDSAAALAMTDRFYEAQCVKDETMGESIAAAHARAGPGAIVVHVNGAFHSDMGLGAAERARRRMPGAKVVVISAVPVDDVAAPDTARYRDRGDYIVFTPRAAKTRQ